MILSVSMRLHRLISVVSCPHWLLCLRHDSIESLKDLVVDEGLVHACLGRPPIAHMSRVLTIPCCLCRLCWPILNTRILVIVIYNQVSSCHRRLLVPHELVCFRLLEIMRQLTRHEP